MITFNVQAVVVDDDDDDVLYFYDSLKYSTY